MEQHEMEMKLQTAVVGLALAGLTALAQAAPLAPNQTLMPFDPSASIPVGTFKASMSELITTPTFTATYRSAVYDGPEQGVNLDFYYQISNSANSSDALTRLSASGFGGLTTNVFQTGQAFGSFLTGNVAADVADRSADGKVIGFDMHPDVNGF